MSKPKFDVNATAKKFLSGVTGEHPQRPEQKEKIRPQRKKLLYRRAEKSGQKDQRALTRKPAR